MQKSKVNEIISYFSSVIKWVCAAALTGFVCGATGILFHHSVEIATKLRLENKIFLYLMPLIGMVIAFLYKTFLPGDKGTGGIFICAARGESPDIKVAPLIFIGTSLTHLAGGSSGREGAALQIGGSIGGNMGKLLRLGKKDMPIIILCGMSAVFSALFGTPLTAAVFCLEVITVGSIYSFALLPCVISALCAYGLAVFTGVKPMGYVISGAPTGFETIMAAKVMVLAVAAALVSVLFCHTMHTVTHLYSRYFENVYVRIGQAVLQCWHSALFSAPITTGRECRL